MTELADGSDYEVNASEYFRLPADSYAAIDMGEPEAAPEKHAVISSLTYARTGGEICLSNFRDSTENTTTPCTRFRTDFKRWKAYSSRNLLKPPTTEHYFISASNQPLLSRC